MHSKRGLWIAAHAALAMTVACSGGGDVGGGGGGSTTGWHWENPLPQGNTLNGVWGSRTNDVWAVGDSGTIVHWNGTAWSLVASGTPYNLYGVWGAGANDVWAVGASGTILRWNGTAWSSVQSPTTNRLTAIWRRDDNDVWAVGGDKALRWSGTSWYSALGGLAGTVYNGVWGSGASDVWVMNGTDGNFAHWNGTSFSSVDAGVANSLFAVWGSRRTTHWPWGSRPRTGTAPPGRRSTTCPTSTACGAAARPMSGPSATQERSSTGAAARGRPRRVR